MDKKYQKGFRKQFTKVKTAKGRKSSSTRWLQRQLNDPYALLAKKHHYRGRAAYKLLEIDDKFNFIKYAKNIIDLGCAPGGWLQVLKERKQTKQIICAVDLQDIEPIPDIHFIKGDFMDADIQTEILKIMHDHKIDLVLSDMAPNTCGHKDTDAIRIALLVEEILKFCENNLEKNGHAIAKMFMGIETDNLIKKFKEKFNSVTLFKPDSSRKDSHEIFLVAKGFNV